MRTLTYLALSAALIPGLAFASPDCGDQSAKTAEAVYTIKTPQQAAAADTSVPIITPVAETIQAVPLQVAPVQDPVVAPTAPVIVKQAQVEVKMTESGTKLAPPVAAYADLLKRRISRGEGGLNLFDYSAAHDSGELAAVTAYTDYLSAQNPDAMSQNDQLAYWGNLYNALTLKVVLENYPVSSIRKIKSGLFSMGPWDMDATVVNGETLTLNDIEHEIMRKKYPNPAYVHYMVNCASIGCPNLAETLWTGDTLEADREQAARDFINSPRGARIKSNNALEVSSIYNWFNADFGGSKSETLKHLRQHAGPELAAVIDAGAKIDGYDYDWSLNE